MNGMPFLLSSYQLRLQIDFFLHVPSLHKCVRPRISHQKTLITNKYFPLIIKIIFRTVIVADCKSTSQFLQLGVRHTRVYLCYCSDRVLYKWRLLRKVLLCCSGWVALLFVVWNGHDTENCALLVLLQCCINGDFFETCYFVVVVELHCCLLYQMAMILRT
jgi:hypothetical protein